MLRDSFSELIASEVITNQLSEDVCESSLKEKLKILRKYTKNTFYKYCERIASSGLADDRFISFKIKFTSINT